MKYDYWNVRAPGSPNLRRELEEAGLAPLCAAILAARGIGGREEAEQFLASGPERPAPRMARPALTLGQDASIWSISPCLSMTTAVRWPRSQ